MFSPAAYRLLLLLLLACGACGNSAAVPATDKQTPTGQTSAVAAPSGAR